MNFEEGKINEPIGLHLLSTPVKDFNLESPSKQCPTDAEIEDMEAKMKKLNEEIDSMKNKHCEVFSP